MKQSEELRYVDTDSVKRENYIDFVRVGASEKYTPETAVLGLVGEVGEVCDVFKKMVIYNRTALEEKFGMTCEEKLIDELGDVLWQLINVCVQLNISVDDVIDHNIKKLIFRHGGVKTASNGGIRNEKE